MQKIFLLLIIAFSYGISFAQPHIIYMKWKDPTIRAAIEHLDSTHLDAYRVGSTPDSKDCVFGGQDDTVGAHFHNFLQALYKTVRDHGIVWNAPTPFFARGYY